MKTEHEKKIDGYGCLTVVVCTFVVLIGIYVVVTH
jgi:hypothetical protein